MVPMRSLHRLPMIRASPPARHRAATCTMVRMPARLIRMPTWRPRPRPNISEASSAVRGLFHTSLHFCRSPNSWHRPAPQSLLKQAFPPRFTLTFFPPRPHSGLPPALLGRAFNQSIPACSPGVARPVCRHVAHAFASCCQTHGL
jgi:hypothetical protein